MNTKQPVPRSLLELPDACLLVVLQCLAADDDPADLACAALAHSRLHQAAVAALTSISVTVFWWGVDSLLLYLDRHGQHISSLDLGDEEDPYAGVTLRQLPASLVQLSSLGLAGQDLQLQPGGGFQGVVTPGLPLKQLRLHECTLLDGEEGLAAALSLLPGLEHLSYNADIYREENPTARFPLQVLPQLPRLTYLELDCELVPPEDPSQGQPALQPLQALSRLVDLRLRFRGDEGITTDMLSGLPHLTRLDLFSIGQLEPGALAGKTALQHLRLDDFDVVGSTAGVAELLSHVQHMQQLTHLDCGRSLVASRRSPPAAAFSALTASSKLQELGFSHCIPPGGVWQHVFPAGRQLPHLTSLQIDDLTLPESDTPAAAPEGSRLVSCCPGLRLLSLKGVQCSATHLAELQGLLALRTLHVEYGAIAEGQSVSVLTQLRELRLDRRGLERPRPGAELLLRLTQLQQLARLDAPLHGTSYKTLSLRSWGPGDEPVWVQLLRRLENDRHPDVAQQAAAALAGWN